MKMSGFKSFVDPTTITVPARVVGVVGPNGCGKSNVIDAVRWVMGESSAKTLRGDSMEDVIFNGSTARKPVGKASVELIFDNSEGRVGGPYAKFSEISMRRTLSRDGLSEYFVNKAKCRRRDITDILRGTGLGSRSYSIIEQGMVSRIVEARPEELRSFVEEAAGISKYKDRRRETETRIRHTRENLLRVEDIRRELETQLRRLQRQSSAAARYKTLKQEERVVQAQLMVLRWHALDLKVAEFDGELSQSDRLLQQKLAEQRAVESEMERLRQHQGESVEHMNAVQGEFYGVGAEIANVEQRIEHARESLLQKQQELERLGDSVLETQRHLQTDEQRVAEFNQAFAECRPRLAQKSEVLKTATSEVAAADQALQQWRLRWEQFSEEVGEPLQEREIQRARMQELERAVEQLQVRQTRLKDEALQLEQGLATSDIQPLSERILKIAQGCADCDQAMSALDESIRSGREAKQQLDSELDSLRDRFHCVDARLKALQELNADALGSNDEALTVWLEQHGLARRPRLAEEVKVEPGWERAVDRILGPRLSAICVEDLDRTSRQAAELTGSELWLVQQQRDASSRVSTRSGRRTLADRVSTSNVAVLDLLSNVYVSDHLDEAMALRSELAAHECVVCPTGEVVGKFWFSNAADSDFRPGWLSRDAEAEQLSQEHASVSNELEAVRGRSQAQQQNLVEWEQEREDLRQDFARNTQQRTEMQARLDREEAQAVQLESRYRQIRDDLGEVESELARNHAELVNAKQRLQLAAERTGTYGEQREYLLSEKQTVEQGLQRAREHAEQAREHKHEEEIEEQRLKAALDSAEASVRRLADQLAGMQVRKQELEQLVGEEDRPEEALKMQLEALLSQRLQVEDRLEQARGAVARHDELVRVQEEDRTRYAREADEIRTRLEQERMSRQELVVRAEGVVEQVRELGYQPKTLLDEMPEDAVVEDWQERLDKIQQRIERIGPVNLVAIEEYEQESERKNYLDKQHEDLFEALATLEGVMRKIDRETRSRFKETFENLNRHFQEIFPKLFGGGSAYLELSSDDLLETGVTVMARPPGKRNSTIHLLSGGEKALTAVSLLFAFFELNPAPFCLLDEVDAPLDDANVERYSETLKSLSARTQLIFITHNKLTMEAADLLIGVTMGEPGVSRLVAVDVERALEMASQ
ncbi:MAG: chromosome segregation protein SMC [Gammaproteobacteria bacterium]|nr:chromosome segregation protein SMC [Gammaproteobacteria bacterium]